MTFDRKITLQVHKQGYGTAGTQVVSSERVWANVSDMGVTTKYAAEAAGKQAELQAVMWRNEFKDYTHAVIDNVLYKIVSTGRAENDLHIKLILSRG